MLSKIKVREISSQCCSSQLHHTKKCPCSLSFLSHPGFEYFEKTHGSILQDLCEVAAAAHLSTGSGDRHCPQDPGVSL